MNIPDKMKNRILECDPRYGRTAVSRDLDISLSKARKLIEVTRNAAGERVDSEQLTTVDPHEMIVEAKRRKEFNSTIDPQESGKMVIELEPRDDGFGRIVVFADAHFGNCWTDYESLWKAHTYGEKERIKILYLGDAKDNFLRPIKGNYVPVYNQLFTPEQQEIWTYNLFKRWVLKGLLGGIVTGNHDMRNFLYTGVRPSATWEIDIPVRHNRCEVVIKCGDATYRGMAIHKEQGNSQWNKTHAAGKTLRMNYPWAEFVFTAHTHVPEYRETAYMGRHIPLIQLGTFNIDNFYSQTAFGDTPFISYPILMFDSDKKRTPTPFICKGFYLDKVITIKVEDL
jgi:hypothetical protein